MGEIVRFSPSMEGKKGGGRGMEDGLSCVDFKEREENYRSVTLMPVTYKVYAEMIRRRLEDWMEENEVTSHNQTGFRKGMGTIDYIILNYLVNRNL